MCRKTNIELYNFKLAFFYELIVYCYLQLLPCQVQCVHGDYAYKYFQLPLVVLPRPHPSINFIFPKAVNTDPPDPRN